MAVFSHVARFGFAILVRLGVVARLAAASEVSVTVRDGAVTVIARDATLRQLLAGWQRVGHTRVEHLVRVPAQPITIELVDVPQSQAMILRSLSGCRGPPQRTPRRVAVRSYPPDADSGAGVYYGFYYGRVVDAAAPGSDGARFHAQRDARGLPRVYSGGPGGRRFRRLVGRRRPGRCAAAAGSSRVAAEPPAGRHARHGNDRHADA